MLISPLNSFPWVINGLVQSWVSLKRLQTFLNLEDLNWLSYYLFNELSVINLAPNLSIDIKDGQFVWKKEQTGQNDLSNLNLKIKKGHLIGVIGKVGSGKTTLLHAIMAELDKLNGKIRIDSTMCTRGFAYVGQECWIKAGTIKENILFGAELDANYYKRVIQSCALAADLNILPKGDETFVNIFVWPHHIK